MEVSSMNDVIDFGAQMTLNYFNMQPSMVKGRANFDVEYHKRYLWNKIYSKFKFTIPEEWKLNWFRYWLFQFGSIAVAYTDEFGWVCYPYSIETWDLYYNPKKIHIKCKFIDQSLEFEVGENAGIVQAFDDFFGLDDVVTHYATQLSQCDKDVQINLMNANVAYVFNAESKKKADEIKRAYGKATEGDPFVCINNPDYKEGEGLTTLLNSPKNNLIVNELLDARRTIMNEFLTEVGINNANTDKKERLITDEVKANNEEVKSIVQVIYENIKMCFDKINALSGLNLQVELVENDENEDESEVVDDERDNI